MVNPPTCIGQSMFNTFWQCETIADRDAYFPEGAATKIPVKNGDRVLVLENAETFSRQNGKWYSLKESSSVKHKVTITPKNGKSEIRYVPEQTTRVFTIQPNQNYLPPKTITVNPSSYLTSYDEFTGTFVLDDVKADTTIVGDCITIPHTGESLKARGFTYESMNKYGLTHDKLKKG